MTFLRGRIVPPAILCVIATYPVWAFAGWLVVVAILSRGEAFLYLAPLVASLLVPGFIVVSLSIVLLVDRAHHRIWGVVVGVLYGMASIWSILIFYSIVSGQGIGSFPVWIALAAALAPPLGLMGAVWSVAWKPAGEEKRTDNQMWNVAPPQPPQSFVTC